MADRRAGSGWLIAALVGAAAAVVLAVVAFLSLSSTQEERDAAAADLAVLQTQIEDAEAARDAAAVDRAAAGDDLREANRRVVAAEQALADAEERESEFEADARQAAAAHQGLLDAAAAFPAAGADVLAAVEEHLATAAELAELRAQQAEAVAGGRYRTYNTLQDRYNRLVDDFNEQADAVRAAVDALPSFVYRGVDSAVVPPAPVGLEEQDTELDPPTGPARVVGSLPDTIPCTPRSDGCRWTWEITFTETNALGVVIDRIGYRYIDTRGSVWILESGEWRDVTVRLAANGTASWDTWVQTLNPAERPNLQGGTVRVRWEGTDAEGNRITGSASARLARRED